MGRFSRQLPFLVISNHTWCTCPTFGARLSTTPSLRRLISTCPVALLMISDSHQVSHEEAASGQSFQQICEISHEKRSGALDLVKTIESASLLSQKSVI